MMILEQREGSVKCFFEVICTTESLGFVGKAGFVRNA